MFGVVVVGLVGNADTLGKEARVVWKVEFAGQEAALLEDVGDVATRACVPCVCGPSRVCWLWHGLQVEEKRGWLSEPDWEW